MSEHRRLSDRSQNIPADDFEMSVDVEPRSGPREGAADETTTEDERVQVNASEGLPSPGDVDYEELVSALSDVRAEFRRTAHTEITTADLADRTDLWVSITYAALLRLREAGSVELVSTGVAYKPSNAEHFLWRWTR